MQTKKPMVLVIAGPNGSGKSTVTQYLDVVGTYTNADNVVATTGMNNIDAAKFVDSKRYESIDNGEDFSFETVLSSRYKLDILKKAKEKGYFLKCIFVLTADPYINVTRVEQRVASGGHDVDKDKIISRYHNSLENIKELMVLCDVLHVYDNTENLVRIIRKHKEDISIFPNEYWDEDGILRLMYPVV